MVSVSPKPVHVIVIFEQPLENCTAKVFTAGSHQVVVSQIDKTQITRLTCKALGEGGPLFGSLFHATAHHLSVTDVRRRLGGNKAVEGASEMHLAR